MTTGKEYAAFIKFLLVALGFAFAYIYLFGNPRISYDGWQYLSSAKAIITKSMPENYFWVRQPGYPLFIAFASLFSQSLWFVFAAQVLSFILAYTFFISECRYHFLRESIHKYLLLAFLNFLFIFVFIGGYFITVTPQAITGTFLLLLTAGVLRTWRIFNSHKFPRKVERRLIDSIFQYLFFPFITVVGYSLSAFIGIIPILCLLLLLAMETRDKFKNSNRATSRHFQYNSKWIFAIILTALTFLSVFTGWHILFTHALDHIRFNEANLQDPFWGDGISSYLENLRRDPALLHYIPASFLALIMFIPNQGWNGVTVERLVNSHSQNGDIGFGLFSANYGDCVSNPPEVLTVNNLFINDFLWKDTCAFTSLDVPIFAYPLIFPLWIVLCSIWIWGIFKRKNIFSYIASVPILVFLGAYSIFGGGIDRYGSSAYPIITFLSIFTVNDLLKTNQKGAIQT